jgi:hypothetical protein
VIPPNSPQTNIIYGPSTNYYLVNVPEYAIWATNLLLYASGPLSVWYSTNVPPTAGYPDDFLFFNNATSGTNVIGLATTPPLVPGGFYYLALADPNTGPLTNVLEVDFALNYPAIGAPVITNLFATNVTGFAATLGASVIPNGTNTTVYFAYGLTNGVANFSATVELTNSFYSTWPVAIAVTNLLPGNVYYFEAIATNSSGATTNNLNGTFTTPLALLSVTTEPATNVTATGATLQAAVNPNGADSTVYFVYGSTTNYGSATAPVALTNQLNTPQWVTNNLTGLLPGVTYHFEAIGTNRLGTNYGGDLTFTNLAEAPSVTTGAATGVTATSATLPASVLPNGAATTVTFEYGTTTNYGSSTGAILLANNLNTVQPVSVGITNLVPGTVYHFQALAANSAGANDGGDSTFTCPPAVPSVTTLPLVNLTPAGVTFPALVNPNGGAATVYFAYGTTTNYFAQTAATGLTTNLNSPQSVTNGAANLLPGVVYHYQAVAANSAGKGYGGDLTFTNPIAPFNLQSITATNRGYWLQWYAPTNYQFKVQWTDVLPPTNWGTFTNVVVYAGPAVATNGLFTFLDDGSQSGGLARNRFYRLELWVTVNYVPPALPAGGAVYYVNPLAPLTVTNAATDANTNAVLYYTVTGSLSGTNPPAIDQNGVITWTPALAQAGLTNILTTVVSDNGQIPLYATNVFTVIVYPIPAFNTIQITAEGVVLQWTGVPGGQYQIGWTTNLLSPWTYVPANPPYLTSPNSSFMYLDTNALNGMKFYELRQWP